MRMTDQQREESIKKQAYEEGFNAGVKFALKNTLETIKERLSNETSYKGK